MIGICGSLILSKTLMELIVNPCGEFRWSPEGPVRKIHSPHLFSDLLRSCQMLVREWGAESNEKLPHQFIPSKTTALIPEFVVEDLPLGRTAALVPEFAAKDLSLGRTLTDDDDDDGLGVTYYFYNLRRLFNISSKCHTQPQCTHDDFTICLVASGLTSWEWVCVICVLGRVNILAHWRS